MSKTHSRLGVTIPTPSEDYLVYTALLTQSGVNAPIATVLKNTLGGTVVWTYDVPGSYIATLVAAFPLAKTWLYISQYGDDTFQNYLERSSDDVIRLYTYDAGTPTDSLLATIASIEIRVYL